MVLAAHDHVQWRAPLVVQMVNVCAQAAQFGHHLAAGVEAGVVQRRALVVVLRLELQAGATIAHIASFVSMHHAVQQLATY